ncbi:uncharacterized protein LOC129587039 [Paramacrobiotus metropolitanus]|uniref:uncharacterized protein LOC129587039 n=1 Tax=Paramacrobiotus metropolitanus TaxID=2943436 RepID=UPI002445B7F6|nr:uncharacterized protein LOC129587039 [Paramacrobiotus metropolitanus]
MQILSFRQCQVPMNRKCCIYVVLFSLCLCFTFYVDLNWLNVLLPINFAIHFAENVFNTTTVPLNIWNINNGAVELLRDIKPPHPLCVDYLLNMQRSENACAFGDLNKTLPSLKAGLFGKSVAFLGDSRMRDLFSYIRSLLSGATFHPKQFYENVLYHDRLTKTKLEFYWCRFPEEGRQIVAQWKYGFRQPPHGQWTSVGGKI